MMETDTAAVPPIVHLVRHAQGYHNLTTANYDMPDPSITPYGIKQCQQLSQTFQHHSSTKVVVASPIRRTLYTALNSFKPELSKAVRIIALPELQETSDLPCDTGSEVKILEDEFQDQPVDLSLVKEGWNSKKGKWAPTSEAIKARAREARLWLRSRTEGDIVVVTHGGFLHYLTQDWTNSKKFSGTGWSNCEYRSYSFAEDDDPDASLIETYESRSRRSRTEKPSTQTERSQFEQTTVQDWDKESHQATSSKGKDDRDWIGAY